MNISKSTTTIEKESKYNNNNNNNMNSPDSSSNNSNNIKTSNSQPTFLTSTMNDENTSPSPTKHSNANEMNVMIDSPPTGLIANRKLRNERDAESRYIREQIALKKKRAAAEEKLKQSLLDKINFTDFDQTYYKDLPIQPGVSFFKWLTPKSNTHSKHAHATRMAGLNAIKLTIPETVVYSDRYMGIPDTWIGTDPKDGCVVKRRVGKKDWRIKFAKKVVNGAIWGIGSLSPSKRKRRKGTELNPDVVGMLKIANRTKPQTTNTRIITPYGIEKSLETPVNSASLCAVQGFIRCKGPRAVIYRLIWRKRKNPYAFCIVNEVNFANMKKKRHDDAPMTDDAIEQMLTRSHCATSDVTNRGSLPALNVFEILGKALNPILEETKKIVKYVERKDSDYGRVKFEEFVGDFIKSKDGEWIFINCKAFKLEEDCYTRIRKQIKKEQADEANGMSGDFANMARQSSIRKMNGKDGADALHGHGRPNRKLKSKKDALLASNGKFCFFCEQKYLQGDIMPLAKVGGSPKRVQRRKKDAANVMENAHNNDGSGYDKPQLFERKVESFGYNMTERMMIDTIKVLNRRGINPFCFSLNLRRLASTTGAIGEVDKHTGVKAKVGESSDMHKVCRPCFEIHNSQRSLVALSRQFALALGVPRLPLSLLPGHHPDSEKISSGDAYYDTMMQKYSILCGPGKNNKASKRIGEGAVSAPPTYSAYARPMGMPPPPPNSLKPGNLDWVEVHQGPRDAKQYRIVFFWHEMEDVLPRKMPKVHAELQYKLVEHVHRIKVDLNARGTEGYAEDCIPLKQLRINYLYASPKALQSYLFTHKIVIKLILTIGEGESLMTAEGTGAMYLSSFLSSGVGRFGQRGYKHKSDMRIPVSTVPLGEVMFRVSVGIVGDDTHLEDNLLDKKKIRLGQQETQHGNKLYWLPENFHDSAAIPESWMGAITHGVKSLRDMKAADNETEQIMTEEEKAEYEIQKIEDHLISLFQEFLNATPVTRYATKKADILKNDETVGVVENMLNLRKQISSHGASRPLAKAMTNMINDISWEKNMNDQEAELNANSLRRDSANVALAHAHTEIEFREQLKKYFDVLLARYEDEAGDGKKRRRKFNRSGSLDGHTRGQKRLGVKSGEPTVKIMEIKDAVDEVCEAKAYKIMRLKAIVEEEGEKMNGDDEQDSVMSMQSSVSSKYSPRSMKPLTEEQLQKWETLSHLLDETLARGTEIATWSQLMDVWNSRKREVSMNLSLEMSGMHIDEALPEVGPESGGDFPYDEHTIDRRWSRLRSSMRIFEHVANEDVRGTKISKNNHPLQYVFVDNDHIPSNSTVVDIGELRAYIAELASLEFNAHFLNGKTIRERILDVVQSYPKAFDLKKYSKKKIENGIETIIKTVKEINECSQSLCRALQDNKLTDHLSRVYDSIASGSISWPEFIWLCENSVKESVLKNRQDAAATATTESKSTEVHAVKATTIIIPGRFKADAYPIEKEKQARVDEISLAIEFERIEETFLKIQDSEDDEGDEQEKQEETSDRMQIEDYLKKEKLKGEIAPKEDDGVPMVKRNQDASALIASSVTIKESVIGLKPLPQTVSSPSEEQYSVFAEKHGENDVDNSDMNTSIPKISPISVKDDDEDINNSNDDDNIILNNNTNQTSTDKLILGNDSDEEEEDDERIEMEYIKNNNNDVPDFMQVTMSRRNDKKKLRPSSAPAKRRSNTNLKPKSESFQKKANQVARQRIAALEGINNKRVSSRKVPQRAKTNALLARRRNNLKKQLAKSNKKARKQRDEVAMQLDEMRAAMAKQLEQSNKRERKRQGRQSQQQQQQQQQAGLSNTYHGGGNTKYSRNYSARTLASSHSNLRRKNRPKSAPSKRRRSSQQKRVEVGKPSLSSTNGGMIVIDNKRRRPKSSHSRLRSRDTHDNNINNTYDNIDDDKNQPMMRSAFVKYCKIGDLNAVENILKEGVNVDTRLVEPPRRTLLQEAARTGRTRLTDLLLRYGANVLKKDDDGCNALYWAYANQHDQVVELLLNAQANLMGPLEDEEDDDEYYY